MKLAGFDWDEGHWKDCSRSLRILVFMLREIAQQTYLRPISARFMHQKEIEHYENQI
jgi:uncharacterized DUF497 family protein